MPEPVIFNAPGPAPFASSFDVMGDGRILLLPTPGHTVGHQSVLVRQPEANVLLAGDLSYSQQALLEGTFGGILPAAAPHRRSMEQVRGYARQRSLVYLPSHDPESLQRLQGGVPLY